MRTTLIGLAAVALAAAPASAQGTLGLTPAVPTGPSALVVTPRAGPWMICAASYTGPPSRGQAEELAAEIREKYGLPAYVFNRTEDEKKAEHERVERLREEHRRRMAEAGLPPDTRVHIKTVRIEDQYAVLVGGYKDDATARKELDRIRRLKPSEKYLQSAYVPDEKGKMREQAINPFQAAFVCRNPSVPVERPAQDDGPDPRLKEYNAGESYSLLKCGKRWTLVVKAYKGASVIQGRDANTSIMARMSMGKKAGDLLSANEKQAHTVAEFLRKFGFEAYVLHTEYNSYVTIGAYDSAEDPRLVQMQQAFVGELSNPQSNVGQLHTKAGVQFLQQPMPMPVPQVK